MPRRKALIQFTGRVTSSYFWACLFSSFSVISIDVFFSLGGFGFTESSSDTFCRDGAGLGLGMEANKKRSM